MCIRDRYALTPLWAVLGSYLLALLACLAAPRIAQPTEYRLEMAGRLLGLRKFIEESELPRIRALAAENPEYFYDVLPYASVFGLEEEWAGRDVYKRQPGLRMQMAKS